MNTFYKEKEVIIKDQKQLEKLGEEWQHKLGLDNWEIKFILSKGMDMDGNNEAGRCTWVQSNKTAIIKILEFNNYSDDLFKFDMEQVLVHELLHIHFAPLDDAERDSQENICLEQAVEQLSKTFVQLKREDEKEND